jgi:hypothetical protein
VAVPVAAFPLQKKFAGRLALRREAHSVGPGNRVMLRLHVFEVQITDFPAFEKLSHFLDFGTPPNSLARRAKNRANKMLRNKQSDVVNVET